MYTCMHWAYSTHFGAAAESAQPMHTALSHLRGWVAFGHSPKALPKQQFPTPSCDSLQPHSAVGWAIPRLNSPSPPSLQGLLPGFLMLVREHNPHVENKQIQQITTSAAFHFSSCSLPLSTAFLGCDPHSSSGEGLQFNISSEVKSFQRQIINNIS